MKIRVWLIALTIVAPLAHAVEDQLYFVGRVVDTPAGKQVYLRWDVVESELPADVVGLRLTINGVAIAPDWPANGVMSADAIAALYNGAEHRARKLETITRLNELASDQGIAFSASQFSTVLHDLIDPSSGNYNALWAYLGSRTDFNIARARYRAWVDRDPTPGTDGLVKYELLAVDAGGATARIGYIEIDPTAQQQPLGASDLEQVRVTDWRCDLPEGAQDHYTVMLDWLSPGAANVADRFAAQNYIAGFDLYRTTENLGPSVTETPVRDIAALAAAAEVDSRGRPLIDGLEKVNVALIIDAGAPSTDPEWLQAKARLKEVLPPNTELPTILPENIPKDPKWVEARDQLMRAGLKPGDRRAYYLVPRDFSGSYGPTVGTIVVVPQMTRPPAPWNLRAFADETMSELGGNDALTFTWDEVDIANYTKSYDGTRLFCNLVEARTTGVLEYVALGESCDTGNRNVVNLDVPAYRIYRFNDFDLAGRFKDSDGDGVSDSDETPDIDGNGLIDAFERSAGTQCDAMAEPAGTTSYLAWGPELENSGSNSSIELIFDSIFNPAPPNVVRMRDTVPAGNRDVVYWYRIASQAASGRLSHMSAPQRGLFPDRAPPDEPDVFVGKPGLVAEGCVAETDPTRKDWAFDESLSLDDKGMPFDVSCGASTFTVTGAQLSSSGTDQCLQIAAQCAGLDVTIDFDANANTGGAACNATVAASEVAFCQSGGVSLAPNLVDGLVPVEPGELVPGGVTVEVTPPAPNPADPDDRICIALYENIDGSTTRIGSTCDPEPLVYTPRPGQFCGYAVATDENNNISTTVQFPCTLTPLNPKAPSPPQVLTFEADGQLARFTFRLPAEQVAVAIARLDYEPGAGAAQRTVESIPVIDNEPGEAIGFSIEVGPLQGMSDRFCLSMLSVGRDNGNGVARNSDWSTEKCFTRTQVGEDLPQYMPWPAVQGAVEGEPLIADRVTNFRNVPEFLAFTVTESEEFLTTPLLGAIDECWLLKPGQANPADPLPPNLSMATEFDDYHCLGAGLGRFRTLVQSELGFIVYRQSRINGGAAAAWVQVSPYINYIHFDREVFQISDRFITLWTLNDPYFRMRELEGTGTTGAALAFVDQYPFLSAAGIGGTGLYEWRYQVVYFDDQRRPVEWRASDWFRGQD